MAPAARAVCIAARLILAVLSDKTLRRDLAPCRTQRGSQSWLVNCRKFDLGVSSPAPGSGDLLKHIGLCLYPHRLLLRRELDDAPCGIRPAKRGKDLPRTRKS